MATATEAWAKHAQNHAVKSRTDFVAGFEAGAFEERLRLVSFISENQETLKAFAGERTGDMLIFILTQLTPDEESVDSGSSE